MESPRQARGRRDRRSASPSSRRFDRVRVYAVLIAATVTAYLPALQAGYIWDDDSYLTENPSLRDEAGLARIWIERGATPQYYPLVFTTFWIEHRIWGFAPLGYHLVNVLLHALNAVLIWVALSRLGVRLAAVIAVVFALHPVHVESVAWITERKNVLSTTFYLAAILAYWRFAPPGPGAAGGGRTRHYVLAIVLYTGALLAKSVTATLPAAILLVAWWKRGRIGRRDVFTTAPLFAMSAIAGLVTIWMETHHVGATGEGWSWSGIERALLAGRAIWFYVTKLLWPADLAFIYPQWSVDPSRPDQYLFPLSVLAVLVALLVLRSRIGRGPAAGALFFAGSLVPAIGFFDVYPFRFSFVADHFQYLASVGFLSLAVTAAAGILRRFAPTSRIAQALAVAAILLLGARTWSRAGVYEDEETLWRDTVQRNPGAWMAYTNLGRILDHSGQFADAYACHVSAVEAKPDYAEGWNNLGVAAERLGRREEAMTSYARSIDLNPRDPAPAMNLANALYGIGRIDEAMAAYRRVIEIEPAHVAARQNLAVLLLQRHALGAALEELEQVVALDPEFGKGWMTLGLARQAAGQPADAVDAFRRAIEAGADGADLRYELGLALEGMGSIAEAARQHAAALAVDPTHSGARARLDVLGKRPR